MSPSLHATLLRLLDRQPTDAELDLVRRAALRVDSPDGSMVAVVMTRQQARAVARLLAQHMPDELDLALRMGADGRPVA